MSVENSKSVMAVPFLDVKNLLLSDNKQLDFPVRGFTFSGS